MINDQAALDRLVMTEASRLLTCIGTLSRAHERLIAVILARRLRGDFVRVVVAIRY